MADVRPVPAVAAIILRDRQILMIRRGSEPGKGLWSIPGGCIELGESIQDALRREVLEETGVSIEVGEFAGVAEVVIRGGGSVRFHYIILDYFARIVSGEIRAASDALECRWIPLSELTDYDVTESLIERLKALGLLG